MCFYYTMDCLDADIPEAQIVLYYTMDWLDTNIPEAKIVDLVVLKVFYKAPDCVVEYIRKNWNKTNMKKPFEKSEIYSKNECSSSPSSSSSEYTE